MAKKHHIKVPGDGRRRKAAARGEPQIGIWWFTPARGLVAFAVDIVDAPRHLGYRDTALAHAVLWDRIIAEEPDLADSEYFSIPRGRVLFSEATGRYRIYASRAVCADTKKIASIRRYFRLPAELTDAVADAHYEAHPDSDED